MKKYFIFKKKNKFKRYVMKKNSLKNFETNVHERDSENFIVSFQKK